METYTLTWIPGQNTAPVSQTLLQVVGGVEQPLSGALDASASSFDANFATDTSVEYLVRTQNADGTKSKDSDHFTFTATNQTPPLDIVAATGLGVTWKSHTDVVPPQASGGRVRLPGDAL